MKSALWRVAKNQLHRKIDCRCQQARPHPPRHAERTDQPVQWRNSGRMQLVCAQQTSSSACKCRCENEHDACHHELAGRRGV
eukprot:4459968-Prymnesium_polylepis.1